MANAKKYTVKEFCKTYSSSKTDEVKETLAKSIVGARYVPYEMKVTICENIVSITYYQTVEQNGIKSKKLYINSPAKRMLFGLHLVKEYTMLEVDFKNSLEEFNLLSKSGLLPLIIGMIPELEFKEFNSILDMVANDVMCNEYELHAFISNQVERFGELIGNVAKPLFERLSNALENIDEKTVVEIVEKLGNANILK